MNDFTKEELEYLFNIVLYQSAENSNEKVINKIQSLIDNYCEHEEDTHCYASVYACTKCGRLK